MSFSGFRVLRTFALLMSLFLVTAFSFAQTADKETHVGLKVGISLPNILGSSDQEITKDYKSRIAPNFGGFVDVGLTRHLSIQAGLDYASQGGKRNGVQPITATIPGLPTLPPGQYFFADFKNTAKLDYLEVPVMAKYRFKKDKKIGYYVNAGPYFGFLMKATTVTKGSSTIYVDKNRTPLLLPPVGTPFPVIPFDAKTDVTDDLNRFNFGITGGGGITFPAKGNYFFIDARGSYGLTTLQKDTINDGKSRTGNLVISFGYAFKIKGN